MSEVCTELCLLIEKIDKAGPKEVQIIKIHIEVMKLVIAKNIKGTGGEIGVEILAGFRQLCDQFSA